MLCSLRLRNPLIVSGVVIIHLLALLVLIPSSFDAERSLSSESILVNLVSLSAHHTNQSKYKSASTSSTITSAESLISKQSEDSPTNQSGGGLGRSLSLMPRQALNNPKPNYPLSSRKLKEQGLVMIKLCINQKGFVEEASVLKSSGFQGLDNSALITLSQWRFLPDTLNLNYSSQCFQAPIQFSLEG